MEIKVLEHIRKVLEKFDDKYLNNEILKRNKIIEDLDAYNPDLMKALLDDELIHKTYTKNIADVEIFEVNQFIQMLEFKEYWEDSYTKYSNKIGLTVGGKFLSDSEDVVLDFPFKDTVLTAGMTKENVGKTGVEEPFLNETLAKFERDELLEPKVFVNAKKYDKYGEHDVTEFSYQDNLILKGNNLVALYSLKERYKGKVKFIYLDPPYNTGSDSFPYNDNFNHATWLTFMKSRLEIAKDLLTENGIISVQCDNNEQAYLKVLLDEIFGRSSFVTTLHIQMSTTQGMKVRAAQNGNIVKNGEYNHIYSKNGHKNIARHLIYDIREEYDSHYSYYIKDDGSIKPLYELYDYRFPKDLSNKKPLSLKEAFKYSTEFAEIVRVHQAEIVRVHQAEIACVDKVGQNIFSEYGKLETGRYIKFVNNGKEYLLTKNSNGKTMQLLRLSESWGITDSYKYPEGLRKIRGDWWPDFYLDMGNIKKEGDSNFSNGKKPERLLCQLIKMLTDVNDIVLDFFMGSATTQAVAMKMHRRFIGIEQMDYINTISVSRLQKVIAGEQGGISKVVNWQSGGSFVYAELMEKNRGYVHAVRESSTSDELKYIFNRMKETTDFNFRVDLDKFESELDNFNLDEQKKELLRILDKNQLYYNYHNIDDYNVRKLISDNDYQFNKSFYQNGDKMNG